VPSEFATGAVGLDMFRAVVPGCGVLVPQPAIKAIADIPSAIRANASPRIVLSVS
jgi:hypothetical protein